MRSIKALLSLPAYNRKGFEELRGGSRGCLREAVLVFDFKTHDAARARALAVTDHAMVVNGNFHGRKAHDITCLIPQRASYQPIRAKRHTTGFGGQP